MLPDTTMTHWARIRCEPNVHQQIKQEVKLELVRNGLKHGQQLPDNFDVECAKLRRYSYWKGEHLFMIDYNQIYTYLFSHCFEKFTKEQRIVLYEYDVQLKMIHEDMARLMPELGKYLYSSKK